MFSTKWKTSEREYDVLEEKDFRIPVEKGVELNSYLYRPDADGKFPVILGVCAYELEDQVAPVMPIGTGGIRGHMEAGDPNFFVRRGYVHVIMNVRGTGKSDGEYDSWGQRETQDVAEAIEWLARQPWSNGKVGMFGPSYFTVTQKRVARLAPPSLKCLFAMFGLVDLYRDFDYQGGILRWTFRPRWAAKIPNLRLPKDWLRKKLGDKEYAARLEAALQDREITSVPALKAALRNPDEGINPMIVWGLLYPTDGPFWHEWREIGQGAPKVPAYLGGDWGTYGLHLPGDTRSWEQWEGTKKFTIGPPIYLDRPVYQYQFEALRWFDHWLKDNDTGILDEPRVKVFIDNTGEWRTGDDWPLPETRWTPFYLHENGLLSEREHWPNEPFSSYVDSPYERGALSFTTPPMVETTEICGPMVLNLYGSTTDDDVLWFISVYEVSAEAEERLLTRGWLRGSQRQLDTVRSTPWRPYHSHTKRDLLEPNEVYNFNIEIQPYGIQLKPGYRLRIRIRSCDDEQPANHLHGIGSGHIARQSSSRVTVYHDADRPSHLLLPIIRGNVIGTFISGGRVTN